MAYQDVPRVVSIGETMAMVTSSDGARLDEAKQFTVDAGGAESNVAAHLAALGVAAAWVSALGDDALGHRVEREIRGRGVDTRWVSWDSSAPTGVYFKDPGRGVLYYRAGSAASRMSGDTIAGLPLAEAEVVHISGITPVLSTECANLIEEVLSRAAALPTRVSFDVNFRAPLWDAGTAAPVLADIARRSDIVFVGLDEAQTLWGCSSAGDVRAMLSEPEILVVKDGDVGATEFQGAAKTFIPAHIVNVVETVGAGDAFAGGYLAALLSDMDAESRLQAGHDRAALVLRSRTDFVEYRAAKS